VDPVVPDALELYGLTLATTGHLKQALESRERLRALEPFVPIYNIITAQVMRLNGQSQASIAILEAVPADPATDHLRNANLAAAYAAAGRYAEAADTLLAIRSNRFSRQSLEEAARLLRSAPEKLAADKQPAFGGASLEFIYAHVGASERILEIAERNLQTFGAGVGPILWEPSLSSLRKTERFKVFARKSGLVDYWKARGWPDLCRPVGADDFACN
jgi:tetratricopeptide (TPR) repeat protein